MEEELKESMKLLYKIMADPELAKTIAKMMRGIVDELVRVGFTEEQAIQIATQFNLAGLNK